MAEPAAETLHCPHASNSLIIITTVNVVLLCCRCKTDAPRETHRGAPLFLRASDVKAAKEAIERQGFVVLKGALTPKQLQDAQKATFSASGAVSLPIVSVRLDVRDGGPPQLLDETDPQSSVCVNRLQKEH